MVLTLGRYDKGGRRDPFHSELEGERNVVSPGAIRSKWRKKSEAGLTVPKGEET